MIVYVGAGSGPLRDRLIAVGHGQMVSRQSGAFRIPKKGRWAFDNGAWTDFLHGRPFGTEQFLKRLGQLRAAPKDRQPDWCVCPDVVSYWMSLEYSFSWRRWLEQKGDPQRWYLALQDFVDLADVDLVLKEVPFDGLFIGGSTRWKLANSGAWVKWGHERKLPVHVARVNGPKRLQWAVNIDADSVDGTGWVRAGEAWIDYLLHMPKKEKLLFRMEPEFVEEGRAEHERQIQEELEWDEENAWWERWPTIAEMDADEFAAWFNEAYKWGIRPAQAPSDPKEFSHWKADLLSNAEHGMPPRFWARAPEVILRVEPED